MTKYSILLVEDGISLGALLPATLNGLGAEVYITSSITEARNWCRGKKPDVIMSEYVLPDGNGLALLDALDAAAPGVPVLFATYDTSIEHAVMAMRSGACDYLIKPLDSTALATAIDHALEQARGRAVCSRAIGNLGVETGEEGQVSVSMGTTLHDAERAIIEATVDFAGSSVPKAARILGVSPSTLYRKMDTWTRETGI